MARPEVDDIDRGILYLLQRNARRTLRSMASVLDIADNTARNRVEALECAGVILGYTVDVAFDRAGVEHCHLFICTANVREREALAERAREFDEVVEVKTLLTGNRNVHLMAVGTEQADLTDVACRIDELGLDIEAQELVQTHSRHPYTKFQVIGTSD